VRVGILGCGSIGTRHAKNAIALGHDVTMYDNSAKALWIEEAARWASTFEAFIDTRPEAVLIGTPAATHADVARQLLEAGYDGPLYVEKPIACSAKEADIFERWPSPVVMVGYNWRWNLEVAEWQKRWIAAPVHLTLQCDTDMASWPGTAYAAPPLECSHEIDLACTMLGPSLTFAAARHGKKGMILDGQSATATYVIDLYWAARQPRRAFLARFRNGQAMTCSPSQASIDASYVAALKHFLACVEGHRRPDCSVMDGVKVLDILAGLEVAG